jgi:hypothetical protein
MTTSYQQSTGAPRRSTRAADPPHEHGPDSEASADITRDGANPRTEEQRLRTVGAHLATGDGLFEISPHDTTTVGARPTGQAHLSSSPFPQMHGTGQVRVDRPVTRHGPRAGTAARTRNRAMTPVTYLVATNPQHVRAVPRRRTVLLRANDEDLAVRLVRKKGTRSLLSPCSDTPTPRHPRCSPPRSTNVLRLRPRPRGGGPGPGRRREARSARRSASPRFQRQRDLNVPTRPGRRIRCRTWIKRERTAVERVHSLQQPQDRRDVRVPRLCQLPVMSPLTHAAILEHMFDATAWSDVRLHLIRDRSAPHNA